ncbi:aldo/keto reductase [Streptomyces sp. NBC_00691]|nr:aldo/keto reductase [Streptomyces sp. NBC_00691]
MLATKGGLVVDDPATYKSHRDGRPAHLRAAVDASRRQLDVDHIDLYQLHRIGPEVPVEKSWGALAEPGSALRRRDCPSSRAAVDARPTANPTHMEELPPPGLRACPGSTRRLTGHGPTSSLDRTGIR